MTPVEAPARLQIEGSIYPVLQDPSLQDAPAAPHDVPGRELLAIARPTFRSPVAGRQRASEICWGQSRLTHLTAAGLGSQRVLRAVGAVDRLAVRGARHELIRVGHRHVGICTDQV